jgi:hydrogenase maturation protease
MRPKSILVVGYGNDLRGDDAAGQRAAAEVGAWCLPGVQVLALHQLTPEVADSLAASARAIFLDAHPVADGSAVRVRRLRAAIGVSHLAHACDPQALLDLAETAFGHAPEAWWITIPAADFAFGAPLSRLTERGVAEALAAVRPLLESWRPRPDGAGRRGDASAAAASNWFATLPGPARPVPDDARAHRRTMGCPTR